MTGELPLAPTTNRDSGGLLVRTILPPQRRGRIDPLADAVAGISANGSAGERASAVEFVLEGLHLNKRLNKDAVGGGAHYRG